MKNRIIRTSWIIYISFQPALHQKSKLFHSRESFEMASATDRDTKSFDDREEYWLITLMGLEKSVIVCFFCFCFYLLCRKKLRTTPDFNNIPLLCDEKDAIDSSRQIDEGQEEKHKSYYSLAVPETTKKTWVSTEKGISYWFIRHSCSGAWKIPRLL